MREGNDFRNQICATGAANFNMAHALAAHFGSGNFHTAFFANNAAIFHAFIFAAQAFVIFDRAKDARAEQNRLSQV